MKQTVFSARCWLFAAILLVTPLQAFGEITEDVRYGPSCEPATRACHLIVKIDGTTTAADYVKLKTLIEQTHRQADALKFDWDNVFVYLDSPGGDIDAAMAIGRLLRKEEASASIGYRPLLSHGICYSACVLILAGAVGRDTQLGQVGIHRPYLEVPKDAVSSERVKDIFQRTLLNIRAYFREMNVSEQLADAMLRIEPEHMHVLDDAALTGYGLTAEDPIARETKELKIAQRYGLSREEYMRRKSLAASRCASEATICYQKIIKTGHVDPRVSPDEIDFSQYGRPVR